MNKTQELEKTGAEINELGTRIEGIKFHLRSLESNMALMNSVRIQCEQNIDLLKSERVIAAIYEFKKIKEELQTVCNKLHVMRIDFNNHNVALERSEKFLIELREKYVILLRNMDGRVIKGNFGGKK
jgi:hypothetical protein